MENLYHQTNRQIQEVQASLGSLERARGEDANALEHHTNGKIDVIIKNCERLDVLVNKEQPTRRANAKLRVDQLKYDCQHLQAALRQIQHRRYQRDDEERQREALLTRSFTTNDQGDTSIAMDAGLQHHTKLRDSHRGMDNLLDHGQSVLENLREQRMTLKGAHKRILDIANKLGLTNTVMRLIEKRTYQDKFILFGGMIVSLVLMFLLWKYFT
ncbi:Golgi SNAP receptor complex member 2-like [Mytilus galloprovincialis]|uniref:GOSR2 n=2 Tax=Mytilus TaxID=6548 RepID=A0A8S3Q6C9_MYTED|nr:BOS1 [Mytilus edulis]